MLTLCHEPAHSLDALIFATTQKHIQSENENKDNMEILKGLLSERIYSRVSDECIVYKYWPETTE